MQIELINPPLTLIYVSNECEGYSSNVFVPDTFELTITIDKSIQTECSVAFYDQYQNMIKCGKG